MTHLQRLSQLLVWFLVLGLVGCQPVHSALSPPERATPVRDATERLPSPGPGPTSAVASFVLTQTTVLTRTSGTSRIEQHVWHEAPDKWRYETITFAPGAPQGVASVTIADGHTIWTEDAHTGSGQSIPGRFDPDDGKQLGYPLYGAEDLQTLLAQLRRCYDPTMGEEARIAQRPVYVIHLGATRCASARSEPGGEETLWVDTETLFVLKAELRTPDQTRVLRTMDVQAVQYNRPLDPHRFSIPQPTAPASTERDTGAGIPPPPPPPARVIGGGTVASGPFTMTLLLYRDARLSPTTDLAPWAYSDLAGVGVFAQWVYSGPPLDGPVTWHCGTAAALGTTVCGETYDRLDTGAHATREGGIVLFTAAPPPPAARSGAEPVRWLVQIATPQQTYGAALEFVLQDGEQGLEPTAIGVVPLTAP